MTRLGAFSHPMLLGFDEFERALERAVRKGGDGYPPYNVERLAAGEGRNEVLRITLAVAGFAPDGLEVAVEENQLVIRGRQTEEPVRTYLYRGIAARRFQRSFLLADGVVVVGAVLTNGLLAIDLERPTKERGVRKVATNGQTAGGRRDLEVP